MKEIQIPLEQFDLEAFLDRTVEFLKEWMSCLLNNGFSDRKYCFPLKLKSAALALLLL
jgi:hypothetical protein